MNQFVPQLILGSALDGSSGAPEYRPHYGEHPTWMFGAHYFFETLNASTGSVDGHAACRRGGVRTSGTDGGHAACRGSNPRGYMSVTCRLHHAACRGLSLRGAAQFKGLDQRHIK